MPWKNGVFYPPGYFDVKFLMMSGEYMILMVGHTGLVRQKMWDLCDRMQIPHSMGHVRLSYNGQAMDPGKTFGDYGISGLVDGEPVTVDMTVVSERPPWPDDDWQ
jgi:hypothetical protein